MRRGEEEFPVVHGERLQVRLFQADAECGSPFGKSMEEWLFHVFVVSEPIGPVNPFPVSAPTTFFP